MNFKLSAGARTDLNYFTVGCVGFLPPPVYVNSKSLQGSPQMIAHTVNVSSSGPRWFCSGCFDPGTAEDTRVGVPAAAADFYKRESFTPVSVNVSIDLSFLMTKDSDNHVMVH